MTTSRVAFILRRNEHSFSLSLTHFKQKSFGKLRAKKTSPLKSLCRVHLRNVCSRQQMSVNTGVTCWASRATGSARRSDYVLTVADEDVVAQNVGTQNFSNVSAPRTGAVVGLAVCRDFELTRVLYLLDG